jgi:hypothetical protein
MGRGSGDRDEMCEGLDGWEDRGDKPRRRREEKYIIYRVLRVYCKGCCENSRYPYFPLALLFSPWNGARGRLYEVYKLFRIL